MKSSTACREESIDPVCGMTVDPLKTDLTTIFNGQTYSFCDPDCREAFAADPHKYLKPKKKGLWGRYMDRLNKATGGKSMKCH